MRVGMPLIIRCLLLIAWIPLPARAAVSPAEAVRVCELWLARSVAARGAWAGSVHPRIGAIEPWSSGDTLLGYAFAVLPQGHVLVPASRRLPPIVACSESSPLDPTATAGPVALLRQRLRAALIMPGAQTAADSTSPRARVRAAWDRLLAETDVDHPSSATWTELGPLLTTRWHQGPPYNDLCPIGWLGVRTPVGCVATAMAQILRYHGWPPEGMGSNGYIWIGDRSCGGETPGEALYASFAHPYSWDLMPDDCAGGCSEAERSALAQLSYDVAISINTNFGSCGSDASVAAAFESFQRHFGYAPPHLAAQMQYDPDDWSDLLRKEIEGERPVFYAVFQHAMVVDGWRDADGLVQMHINYGWDGTYDGWYALDEPPGGETASATIIRRLVPPSAVSYRLAPDGSSFFENIAEAIAAAPAGQEIVLADGVYRGIGNRDLQLDGKPITIRSESGDPRLCVIDCEHGDGTHRAFRFTYGDGPDAVVEGITIRGGGGPFNGTEGGGAIACFGGSSPTLRRLVLTGNEARSGGALYFEGGRSVLEDCTIADNRAEVDGSALLATAGCQATLLRCTIVGNRGAAAVTSAANARILLDHTIVAANAGGCGVDALGSGRAQIRFSDLWGNEGGDWTGAIAEQLQADGNLWGDPLFCGMPDSLGGYRLAIESPCGYEEDPTIGRIGAWPVGCGVRQACDAGSDPAAGHPAGKGPDVVLSVSPVPARGPIRLGFRAPAGSQGVLTVFAVDGRTVRTFAVAVPPRGYGDIEWDGLDGSGRLVGSGVYWARLVARSGSAIACIIRIR